MTRAWQIMLCLLAALSMAACSTRDTGGTGRTIGALAASADAHAPSVEAPAASPGDRRKAMAAYERFLAEAPDSQMRAEAMRRLADLRLAEAEAAGQDAAQREHPKAAIRLYEQLLREYPDHPRNDQVLYQLSRAHDYNGDTPAALAALNRLVREYPQSPLIAESHFRRAETLFAERRYGDAADAYRQVLALGTDTLFYEQSLYKLGWALFRENQFEASIESFMALLVHRAVQGRIQPERLERADRERAEDSLRAIALSFSYLEGPDAITRYFEEHGPREDEDVIYGRLAEQYLQQERFSDAAAAYRAFVQRHPTAVHSPRMQLHAIESYRRGGFPTQVLVAKREYVELFDLTGEFWRGRDLADHPDVIAELETNFSDLARHYHATYQEQRDDQSFGAAARWYRRYLAAFGKGPAAQETHFMFGELLFEHGEYAEAVRHYEHAAYQFDRNSERTATAAYAALLAYEKRAEQLSEDDAARDEWEQRSLASARRFSKTFPTHAEAPAVLTRAIERYFQRGDTAAATEAAAELLSDHPRAAKQHRVTAWSVLAHIRFDAGAYLQAEEAYREALALAGDDADRRAALQDGLAAAIYRRAEQLRDQGDAAAAVDEFLRVPASRFRATAEFDAGSLLMKLEHWQRATQVLDKFRQNHPDHELAHQATRSLAVAYQQLGAAERAAVEFVRVAEEDEDVQIQQEALLRAAQLYQQAKAPQREAAVLETYVKRFPTPLEPMLEARQRLAQIHDEAGRTAQARRQREAIIAADRKAGDARTARTRFLAAHASLELARQGHAAYSAVALREPLERNLERKRKQMESALRAYETAAAYQVAAVTTAATFYSGQLYAEFAQALMESERPPNLDREALEEYELLLEEQAYPFEERAIEFHEINVARAAQGHFDDWVQRSYAALAQLMPARYRKEERHEDLVEAMH